jgi:hypothetical protein
VFLDTVRAGYRIHRMSCPPCLRTPSNVSRGVLIVVLASLAGCRAQPQRVFRDVRPGAELRVPSEAGLIYQVAAAPGGASTCWLLAIDQRGAVLARDRNSGPLGLPKLPAPAGAHTLRVEGEHDAPVHVYVNDPATDRDGDGLGRELERELRTCDAPNDAGCERSPLRDYYQSVQHATRDTDRDGLSDSDELFGVAGEPLLDLPRFGANPRHKDVFVEIDLGKRVERPGMVEGDLVQVAALFARGPASTLKNPDGARGVALHFDAGFAASDRKRASLLGDWGGSGTSSGDYKIARKESFSKEREHYYRYAVLARAGLGQSSGDAFGINRDGPRVALFAHELAHTLGLKHEGHPSWGAYNCKPNHLSIINYAFQNLLDVGFSLQPGPSLNPTRVLEHAVIDAQTAERLRRPPFELDASVHGVDWNRDGVLSEAPVRAGVTWATYKSCAAGATAQIALASGAHPATPALTSADGVLHAFWIDATGALAQRPAVIGERCTEHKCAALLATTTIAGISELAHIAVTKLDAHKLALAHVSRAGDLGVSELALRDGTWAVTATRLIAPLATHDAPAIALHGGEVVLLFRALDGALMQALVPLVPHERASVLISIALDQDERPILTRFAPSALMLGTGELCGVFPDLESHVRFYCRAEGTGAWADLSARAFYATLGPKTGGPVGLAYHRFRYADGGFVGADAASEDAGARGAIYLTFTEPAPGSSRPDNPNLLISQALDRDAPARHAIDFRWRGNVINQWTHVAQGTAVALYEDESLPGLVAALPVRGEGEAIRIDLLPVADGTFSAELGAGNDFAVMERGICTGLRGTKWCGGPKTGAY